MADLYGMHLYEGNQHIATTNFSDILTGMGVSSTVWSYEGGQSNLGYIGVLQTDRTRRSQEVSTHPDTFWAEFAFCQRLDYEYGLAVRNIFTLDDTSNFAGDNLWVTYYSDTMPTGTGDPSEYLTPWDISTVSSQVGGAYKLYATYTPSSPIPTPTQLVVTSDPPSSTVAGGSFGLMVTAEDGSGNVGADFAGNVTIAIDHNAGGGTLSGTLTQAASAGIATFTGLSINKAASGYTIKATSSGLTSVDTTPFAITAGTATALAYTDPPPSSVWVNRTFNPIVSGQDSLGNTDPTFTASVSVALLANPGSATLGGTLTHTAVAGSAAFTSLTLNVIDTGYTIRATSSGLTSVTSGSIAVVAAPAVTGSGLTSSTPNVVYCG